MKYCIVVNEGPYQHQAADSAWHFVTAAIAAGHEVLRVFFYHDGVLNGSSLSTAPQGERNVQHAWSELAMAQQLDLVLCIAAGQRRGIVDDSEKERLSLPASNVLPGFRIGGLGQLAEATISADRVVTFGD